MIAKFVKKHFGGPHKPRLTAIEIFKYIGPGLLVTVGFIDPGNWASNVAAGSAYGYKLLWMVTLSTFMLIVLQHNAAHLGIATGYCLSESASIYFKPSVSKIVLGSAIIAAISTAFAEILGGAIALNMLFKIPLKLAAFLIAGLVVWMLFTNSYKKLEKWIISFVSIISLSFLIELLLVKVDWGQAVSGWLIPSLPEGSMPIIMSVLGAVVMPHNLFLHSEVIQSRQWNLEDNKVIRKQLKYEFTDTLLSVIIGWAINSAIILVSASAFFTKGVNVTELDQAQQLLKPLIGGGAAVVFAIALMFSGIASSFTASMAGGSIFAGIFKEPYDIKDSHSKLGVVITIAGALAAVLFVSNPFNGLVMSQMLLSIQLPITIASQIFLTSSKKVMGRYSNSISDKIVLFTIGIVVVFLNIILLIDTLS